MICGPSLYFQINFHIILILTETSGLSKVISRAIAAPCSLDTLPGQGQHLPVAPPSSDGARPLVLRDASSHLLVAPPTSGGATLFVLGAVSSWLPNFGFSGAWLSEAHVEHVLEAVRLLRVAVATGKAATRRRGALAKGSHERQGRQEEGV